MDLFVVPTIGFDLLHAYIIVRLDRRELVWINVAANPTAEWVARQITEAFVWDGAPGYMIRDRDRIYGSVVTRRLHAMGIRDGPTAPAFALAEWFCRTADRIDPAGVSGPHHCPGRVHLHRILKSYARYYNETSTHLAWDKDAPLSRTVKRVGRILCRPILGGLHHDHARV